MSTLLYRLGRFSARHPWRVISAWLVVAIAVVAASGAFGKELDDSFEVPGVDSQLAVDLLDGAGSDQAGLAARVVVAPLEAGTSVSSVTDEIEGLRATLGELDKVIGVSDPFTQDGVSADGRVAVIQVQYPVMESLDVTDLEHFVETVEEARVDSALQIEAGGDLFFAFGEAEAGAGEMIGILIAMVVLLVAFGSVIAMGLPIGMALFGLAVGMSSMSLVAYVIDVPSWAPQIGSMIGLGVASTTPSSSSPATASSCIVGSASPSRLAAPSPLPVRP